MAAPVAVDHARLAVGEPLAGALQAGVRQLGVRGGADGPGRQHPVEAVDDGREVHLRLARARQPELGDVGQPEPVGGLGAERPPHEVGRGLGDLPRVGAPPLRPPQVRDDAALLGHELAHLALPARYPALREAPVDVAVAARAPGALELLDDRGARLGPLVGRGGRRAGVVVAGRGDAEPRGQAAQRMLPLM